MNAGFFTSNRLRFSYDGSSFCLWPGMVSVLDELVGQVVGLLRSTGHYHNAVIAFSSDVSGFSILFTTSYSIPLAVWKYITFYLVTNY